MSGFDILDFLKREGLAGYRPMGKYWLLYQPDEKKTLLNNMKQGFKIHVGFLKKDATIVLQSILQYLIKNGIDHKVISSLNHDLDGTQRGKSIAIYVSDITPEMQKGADLIQKELLKVSVLLARKVLAELDQIMHGLIKRGEITREIFFHRDGDGGDKYLEGGTGMVGYRIGSFVANELDAYSKGNYIKIHDDREFYKHPVFEGITLTYDAPVQPVQRVQRVQPVQPVQRVQRVHPVQPTKPSPDVSPLIIELQCDVRILRAVRSKIDMRIVSTEEQMRAITGYVNVLTVTGDYRVVSDIDTLRNYRRNLTFALVPVKRLMPHLFE